MTKVLPPKPTHAELSRILENHLYYEVVRFVSQFELLCVPAYRAKVDADVAEAIDDALIVSFCSHARNLLEFFFREDRTKFNYTLATDYGSSSYKRRNDPDAERLYGQLCAQINHLTNDRTDDGSKKIQAKERNELVVLIHDEVVRLEPHLSKAGFDSTYLAIDRLSKAKAATLTIRPGAVEASPAISSTTFSTGPLKPVTSSTTPSPPTVVVNITPLAEPGAGHTGPTKPPGS